MSSDTLLIPNVLIATPPAASREVFKNSRLSILLFFYCSVNNSTKIRYICIPIDITSQEESTFFLGSMDNKRMKEINKEEIGMDMPACKRKMLPVLDALAVLEGRWIIPIIIAIGCDNTRFKEIGRAITGITDKSLSKALKQMVEDQLIERIVHNTFPPKVEYKLSEHSNSLENVITALQDWGLYHRKHILGEVDK